MTRWRRNRWIAVGAGTALLIATVAVMCLWPRLILSAYLAAMVLLIGLPLGCAAVLAVFHLTGGRWGIATRPMLEAGAGALLWSWIGLLPIVVGMRWVFPWAEAIASLGKSDHAPWYLNEPFFIFRQAVYAVVWATGGLFLTRRRLRAHELNPGFAAGWLCAYAVTASAAAVDWIVSLQPGWSSTIMGMYMIVGQGLTALAAVAAVSAWRLRDMPAGAADILHDLGNLMLMGIVLHAYLSFFQYFIIWNGNLPMDDTWYVPRVNGMWGGFAAALMLVHFGIPFSALLFTAIKRNAGRLLCVAVFVLIARFMETAWVVLPSQGEGWPGLGVMLGIVLGGTLIGAALLADRWTVAPIPHKEGAA